ASATSASCQNIVVNVVERDCVRRAARDGIELDLIRATADDDVVRYLKVLRGCAQVNWYLPASVECDVVGTYEPLRRACPRDDAEARAISLGHNLIDDIILDVMTGNRSLNSYSPIKSSRTSRSGNNIPSGLLVVRLQVDSYLEVASVLCSLALQYTIVDFIVI